MHTDTKAFSISEAIRFGWEETLKNLKPILLVGATGAFLGLLNQALTAPGRSNFGTFLLDIPVQLARVAVTLVMLRLALRLYDERRVAVDELWSLTRGYVPFLLTSLLLGVMVSVGFVLFVVPGVYLLLRFGFATYLTAEEGLEPVAALKASQSLTEGVRGELALFGLALCGVNLLGALALGLGLFLSIPTSVVASVYVYRKLKGRAQARAVTGPPAVMGPLAHAP